MKRDCDGNPLLDTCFDKNDLQGKIRALVDFTTESCSYVKYHDDFLIDIEPDQAVKGRYNIKFHWYCHKFLAKKDMCVDDARNHESLLRKHFASYHVLIHKCDLLWDVLVSTPSKPPGIHCVSVPASATPSQEDNIN